MKKIGNIVALVVLASVWGQLAGTTTYASDIPWSDASEGLRCRIKPRGHVYTNGTWIPADEASAARVARASARYELVFEVELQNVSDHSLTILSPKDFASVIPRNGANYGAMKEVTPEDRMTLQPREVLLVEMTTSLSKYWIDDPYEDYQFRYRLKPAHSTWQGKLSSSWLRIKLPDGIKLERPPQRYSGSFNEGLAPILVDGKYGFINTNGEIVVKPVFGRVSHFTNGVALFHKTDLQGECGYINTKGDVILRMKRLHWGVPPFDGMLLFEVEDKVGYANESGKIVIEPKFAYMKQRETFIRPFNSWWSFREGMATIPFGDKCGYIDRMGNIAIPPRYDEASVFVRGLARVKTAEGYSFIDKTGKRIAGPYTYAKHFMENIIEDPPYEWPRDLTAVYVGGERDPYYWGDKALAGGKWGYINTNGQMVIPPQFDEAYGFGVEGLANAEIGSETFLIDRQGRIVTGKGMWMIREFHEGLAEFIIRGSQEDAPLKHGYLDTKGRPVIKAIYEDSSAFSEGLAGIRLNGKWGFIDSSGNMVIKPIFDEINYGYGFNAGRTPVKKGELWGVIDKSGRMIADFKFTNTAGRYSEGFLGIEVAGKFGYINMEGNYVWEPTN
jgi:hypothetical protein